MIKAIHFLLKLVYPKLVWEIPSATKKVYLTFDDGPIPEVTEWVLNELEKYNAKATFFCIGDNVQKHPQVVAKIVKSNHAIGNHTFNHLNGWSTSAENYLYNLDLCQTELEKNKIKTTLFRPPYGKIKSAQAKQINQKGYSVIMWGIISKDYDQNTSKATCVANVLDHVKPGSIIVMHDSLKAFPNLEYALPIILKNLTEKGYSFEKIT